MQKDKRIEAYREARDLVCRAIYQVSMEWKYGKRKPIPLVQCEALDVMRVVHVLNYIVNHDS